MLHMLQKNQNQDVYFKDSVDISEDSLKVTLERLSSKISEIFPLAVFQNKISAHSTTIFGHFQHLGDTSEANQTKIPLRGPYSPAVGRDHKQK